MQQQTLHSDNTYSMSTACLCCFEQVPMHIAHTHKRHLSMETKSTKVPSLDSDQTFSSLSYLTKLLLIALVRAAFCSVGPTQL